LWHRMYPVMQVVTDPNDPTKKGVKSTPRYIELLTIFPNDSDECLDFLDFLVDDGRFQQLWGKRQEIDE